MKSPFGYKNSTILPYCPFVGELRREETHKEEMGREESRREIYGEEAGTDCKQRKRGKEARKREPGREEMEKEEAVREGGLIVSHFDHM